MISLFLATTRGRCQEDDILKDALQATENDVTEVTELYNNIWQFSHKNTIPCNEVLRRYN